MQPSCLPIAPISRLSSPFYRPVTITLYNTCHSFFTPSKESQLYFGNLTGPVPSHFTYVHFTPCPPACLLAWHLTLHWSFLSAWTSQPSLLLPLDLCRLFAPFSQAINVFTGYFTHGPLRVSDLHPVMKHLHCAHFSSSSHKNPAPTASPCLLLVSPTPRLRSHRRRHFACSSPLGSWSFPATVNTQTEIAPILLRWAKDIRGQG
jgi:hypothetical protein